MKKEKLTKDELEKLIEERQLLQWGYIEDVTPLGKELLKYSLEDLNCMLFEIYLDEHYEDEK